MMNAPTSKVHRCALCSKLFATRKALKQHRMSAHGARVAPSKPSATSKPQRPSKTRRQGNPATVAQQAQNLRMSGVDVLGVSTLTASMAVGTPLLTFVVNPLSMSGTRIEKEARLWSRWRPISLKIEVVSSAGLMIPGGYLVSWSADPQERITSSGSDALVKLAGFGCQLQNILGQKGFLQIPCITTSKWYTMHGDSIDDSHGVVLAVLTGSLGIDKISGVSLTWKLHWTIEFNGPDVPVPAEEAVIEPDPEYLGVFTDSVSDWAEGKKLTFKHAEGGSVVPWPGVKSNMVYTITSGVKITAKNKDKASFEVKWFSRMKDSASYESALVVHNSKADAISYQQTGDLTKILDYFDAGDWAVPLLPRLKGEVVSFTAAVSRIPETRENSLELKFLRQQHQLDEITSLLRRLTAEPSVQQPRAPVEAVASTSSSFSNLSEN